jgi:hypothetical protein
LTRRWSWLPRAQAVRRPHRPRRPRRMGRAGLGRHHPRDGPPNRVA